MPESTTSTTTPDPKAAEAAAADEAAKKAADAADPEKKYAGKYPTQQKLEEGYREIRKANGIPIDEKTPLTGEGGMFSNVLALEEEYKAQGAMHIRMNPPKPEKKPEAKPPKPGEDVIGEPDEDPDPMEIVKESGVDVRAIADRLDKTGKALSDEDYEKLKAAAKKKGVSVLPRRMAESMAANMIVNAQTDTVNAYQQFVEIAGGEQEWEGIRNWAKGYYKDPAEKADMNARLANPKQRVGAAKQMLAEFREDTGAARSHQTVRGETTTSTSGAIDTKEEYDAIREKIRRGEASPAERAAYMATDSGELHIAKWKPGAKR